MATAITATFPASDPQLQSEPIRGNRTENPYLVSMEVYSHSDLEQKSEAVNRLESEVIQ